jgi:hypothetical protein
MFLVDLNTAEGVAVSAHDSMSGKEMIAKNMGAFGSFCFVVRRPG